MGIFNQYSYVFISLTVTIIAVVILLRLRVRPLLVALAGALLVGGFVTGWLLLRPGDSDVQNLAAAEAVINSGNPTLVEFYSNYCAGCIAARGVVDELVTEMDERFGGDFNILRVDIHTDFGRILRERYGFSYTPEFVIFDHAGSEVWRSHVPPSINELEMIAAASGAA